MPHTVILCADDYGLSPGVGTAIRDLIGRGRLTATSCMTVCRFWPEEAPKLKPLASRADVGLHLTLTDQAPLGPMPTLAPQGRLPPLGALMRLAYTGGLDAREVGAEVDRQVAAFADAFGAPPAYIDGHQHVHQLPVVRDAVLAALARLPGAYVRLCREPRLAVLRRGVAVAKTLLIAELGGPLAARVRAAGIPANRSFRGVYDFSGRVPFGDLMARFLEPPAERALVMVHPGIPDEALRAADPLVDQRAVEHEYLKGDAFAALLAGKGVRLGRFAEA
ncbi:ChbG/HpnK family deacetylase [Azospirillum sp.]|uniref:ChbG/HpnK family deacetylase n=1 Tax=Azospirillum sp. TaxID=34012 RepID=UPI003D702618